MLGRRWGGVWKRGSPCREGKLLGLLWDWNGGSTQKLERPPRGPIFPVLGIYLKDFKSTCPRNPCTSVFLFFPNIYLFYYAYNILSACMPAGQKRASDPITDGCEPPCGCWELNSGPLEEQAMLLTSEPSLQPHISVSYSPAHTI